ncbi:MAG: VOC family protein [Burkholderiales bacterium]
MELQPYLFFDGRCDEAIEFYKRALRAKVEMLMRFKESPDPVGCPTDPAMADKVMHSSLRIGNATVFASDGHCQGKPTFQGFSLSLTLPSVAEVKRVFDALADGGQVQMPLAKTFWTESFGMVSDRFGVGWMVMATPQ